MPDSSETFKREASRNDCVLNLNVAPARYFGRKRRISEQVIAHMNSADICLDKLRIQVARDMEGLKILVSKLDEPSEVTSFPTDLSLLIGVLEGYSYQVASPERSLVLTVEDQVVQFQFDSGAGGIKCKTEKAAFEHAIRSLKESDV